jgi:hypothetical protein
VGIGTAAPESIVHLKDTGNVSTTLQIESAASQYAPTINFDGIVGASADYLLGEINGSWDTHTNVVSAIRFESGADTTNKDDGLISFWTSSSGPTLAERMRIDSSGNVGIGNSSASSFTGAASQNLVVGSGSGNAGMTVYSGTTSVGGLAFADGTALGSHYRGLVQYRHSDDAMLFYTGEAERLRIDSAGSIYGSSATGMTKFANYVPNYVSVADDGTITLTAATAGAMFIHVYDQGLGDGAVFFATYRGIAVLVTESASNTHPFSASDTDGAYCVIKSSNSHTVTFKNRTGALRQMGFLISGSNVD